MNYIPKLLEMLEVKEGEKFNLEHVPGEYVVDKFGEKRVFYFSKLELLEYRNSTVYYAVPDTFVKVLNGLLLIKKVKQ